MMALSRREALGAMAGLLSRPARQDASNPWPAFRTRYLAPEGRIVDTGNGGISHSEGQGYGLLLSQAANDRASFDALWAWTQANLMRADAPLFSWRFDPRAAPPVDDPNNATDGDLLIAWALLRAGRSWRDPDLTAKAQAVLGAAAARLVVDTALGPALLPGLAGFRTDQTVTVNPSYWIWPALADFQAFDPAGPWAAVSATGERLTARAAFGSRRLPADWVDLGGAGDPVPAAGRPPRFGYDAIRAPLYLAWAGRRAELAPFRALWRPYLDQNRPPPAWFDLTSDEVAAYPASPGAIALARWIAGSPWAPPPASDYYGDVLAALVWLARSESSL